MSSNYQTSLDFRCRSWHAWYFHRLERSILSWHMYCCLRGCRRNHWLWLVKYPDFGKDLIPSMGGLDLYSDSK